MLREVEHFSSLVKIETQNGWIEQEVSTSPEKSEYIQQLKLIYKMFIQFWTEWDVEIRTRLYPTY